MKKILASFLYLFLLLGCSLQPKPPPTTPHTGERSGQQVAADLTARYNNKASNCGSPNEPAFKCSGVVFRGTVASTAYRSWNPSPASVQSGGVSFSYLRADSKYNSLAYNYNHGFIIHPDQSAPSGKVKIPFLCSFPLDAATLDRDQKGCGQHVRFPTTSRECQAQGITSAAGWWQHYQQVASDRRAHQCGFNITSQLGAGAVNAFNASLQSMALDATESFTVQNELRLATWAQNIGTTLPIEALFYISGGLSGAQFEQRDFLKETGISLPIILLTLPANQSANATFTFREADQPGPYQCTALGQKFPDPTNCKGFYVCVSDGSGGYTPERRECRVGNFCVNWIPANECGTCTCGTQQPSQGEPSSSLKGDRETSPQLGSPSPLR